MPRPPVGPLQAKWEELGRLLTQKELTAEKLGEPAAIIKSLLGETIDATRQLSGVPRVDAICLKVQLEEINKAITNKNLRGLRDSWSAALEQFPEPPAILRTLDRGNNRRTEGELDLALKPLAQEILKAEQLLEKMGAKSGRKQSSVPDGLWKELRQLKVGELALETLAKIFTNVPADLQRRAGVEKRINRYQRLELEGKSPDKALTQLNALRRAFKGLKEDSLIDRFGGEAI